MTDDVRHSLDRIHAALARIEVGMRKHRTAAERSDRLRARTEAALVELDTVIARVEAGTQP